jgi:[acyl-carrier-protein] S-malonyltransferase
MTIALLFSGQGTQHPHMLPWLDAHAEAASLLGALAGRLCADWRQRLADTAWAQANAVAQPLMTACCLAAWTVLAPRLPRVVAVAGYSVGELASFAAAGVFSTDSALLLADVRAAAMDRCNTGEPAGLLSLSGVSADEVSAACERWSLEVAIRLAPDQCVVGGTVASLTLAAEALAQRGVQTRLLGVRVASHTSAMRPAATEFAKAIESMPFNAPRTALVTGYDGASVRSVAGLRAALAGQIASQLRWADCVEAVAERQPACVLEVGPGTSLARLWRKSRPDIAVRSVDEFSSAEAVLRWVDAAQRR